MGQFPSAIWNLREVKCKDLPAVSLSWTRTLSRRPHELPRVCHFSDLTDNKQSYCCWNAFGFHFLKNKNKLLAQPLKDHDIIVSSCAANAYDVSGHPHRFSMRNDLKFHSSWRAALSNQTYCLHKINWIEYFVIERRKRFWFCRKTYDP